MMTSHLIILTVLQILGVQSLIVPDEIPTLLSVIYSNIPVIKKGTDSRIGWGFRLGDRADFQIMVELGPQTYTQPLANQEDKNTNSKRNAVNSLADTLYAQRQRDKEKRQKMKETEGGKWLEAWSNRFRQMSNKPLPLGAKPGIAVGEIDAKSVIPDDEGKNVSGDESAVKLIKLYDAGTEKESESATESETVQGPAE